MTKDPRIEMCKSNPTYLLVKNCSLSVKEIEDMTRSWKTTKRVGPLAASFSKVSELEEKHIAHFRTNPYMFKPMSGTLFCGMCLDDSLDYVHLVMMTEDVLSYILDLK